MTEKTVRSAEKFTDAVDKVSENTGINPQKILSGAINASRRDIQNVSRLEPELQKKVFEKLEKNEVKNVKDAVEEVKPEEKKEQARPKIEIKEQTVSPLLSKNSQVIEPLKTEDKSKAHNEPLKTTAQKIAEQSNVGHATVKRAEKFFDNKHDVINWVIDNQLSRRNITDDQRAYLIGKRYKEEKKAIGANKESIKEQVKQINKHAIPHSEEVKDDKSTSAKIAEQSKVSHATVERAEKFADAVDKVAENTGINPQKILSGQISATRKDIQDVSKLAPEVKKKVFEKVEKNEQARPKIENNVGTVHTLPEERHR